MEKSTVLVKPQCLNCGASVNGAFCDHCGQRVRDNLDRSLARLLGEFFSNIFFFDNRFFLSVWYLIRYPGRITVAFLAGKRKKFISPVTLFLFLNLIYFFIKPLSDYSLALDDQINLQLYSGWAKEWVALKLQTEGLDMRAYAISYQNMSDTISKSIMIINIPMIASFVYLMAYKKRRFYFDSLIFAFHFFTLFMLSWVMLGWAGALIDFLSVGENSIVANTTLFLFAFIIPLFYAILGIKKFMDIRWYWAIFAGIGVMIAVQLANIIYRFIIFMVTFWVT